MGSKPSYEELAAEYEKFRTMVENANDAIFVIKDGLVKYANPKAVEMSGATTQQLGRLHFTEYLHPEERELVAQRHARRLQGEALPNVYPIRIKNRDGEIFWAELNSVLIDWDGGPATLNVIREISGQKIIEENAFQTESLSALRTLAGGLAHSLNNLLMGIQGRVSILNRLLFTDDQIPGHLRGIEACVQEACRLTKQIEGFAQTGDYLLKEVDLNEVIRAALRDFGRLEKSVTLKTDFVSDLWKVAADRTQMELVIVNLLLNAWQAVPRDGRVFIRTENVILPEARNAAHDSQAANYVKCTIRDQGCGMSEEVRANIYQPFFTTKDMAKHRGLGLSSVYGIVKNHNGLIDIESEVGRGTQVAIFIPAAFAEVK